MTTIEQAHEQRWYALKTKKQIGDYNPDNGIPTFWRQHPELGSPLGPETPLDGGGAAQVFAGGVVQWDPDNGARVVTE